MSEITDFYISWLGPPAFGMVGSPQGSTPLPPTPPIVIPDPIAAFDFNLYGAGDSTLVNTVDGGNVATINEPLQNVFVSDVSNSYLEIYAPNNFPSQTGGITLPSLQDVTAIELWMQYPNLGNYGQYFLDARTGSGDTYYIVSDSGTDVSGAWLGGSIYLNTLKTDISGNSPNIATDLSGQGWYQVVIVPSSPINDDIALFMRYTGEQGMPVYIAEMLVYDSVLTETEIQLLYNARCERYGLAKIVIPV